MRTRPATPRFATLLNTAINEAGLGSLGIADAAGIHRSTLSRIRNGKGPGKNQALALISAVNKLAGYEALDAADALAAIGSTNGSGHSLADAELVAEIVTRVKRLSTARKQDILAVVEALEKRT